MKKEFRVILVRVNYCKNCGKVYPKVSGSQKFCGSVVRREGCSYLVHKNKMKERYRVRRKEIREQQSRYYFNTLKERRSKTNTLSKLKI